MKALRDAGAAVFLCKGLRGQGSFHNKAVVVDRRYLYSGGANITYKSHSNDETVYRITGPVVLQILGRLAIKRETGKPWVAV